MTAADVVRVMELCRMDAPTSDLEVRARDRELLKLAREHMPALLGRVLDLETLLERVLEEDEQGIIDVDGISVDLHTAIHRALGEERAA